MTFIQNREDPRIDKNKITINRLRILSLFTNLIRKTKIIGIRKIFMTCGCIKEFKANGVVKPTIPKVKAVSLFFDKTEPRKCILDKLSIKVAKPIIDIIP
jgi:hypothetical protein